MRNPASPPPRRRAAACALALLALAAAWPPARAGDDLRALAARKHGRIVALEVLIRSVDAVIPGRLLEAELEEDDGVPIYELRWQLADGRRLEIEIDARDGSWLKLEGRRLETTFRRPPAAAPAAPR